MQSYKLMNKVTYAEALKAIGIYENKQNRPKEFQDNLNDNARYAVPQSSDIRRYQPGRPAHPQNPCNHKCKVEENTLMVEKKSFIAFMCKVINIATRQERQSEIIKTVVEAAEEFLGIKEVKAEDIHSVSSVNNDEGSQSVNSSCNGKPPLAIEC